MEAGLRNVGTGSPGFKLDVVGNARASGDLMVDTDTLFVDATNNRVGIGTTSPNSRLHVTGGQINAVGGLIVVGNASIQGTPGVNGIVFPDNTTQTTAFLGGGGGSVTSLSQGTGIDLTPDTITTTGTVAIDTTVVPQKGVANTFTTGPQTVVTGTGGGNRGLIVKGDSTQSANLQEWQNSGGTALAAVNPAGFYVGPSGMMLAHGITVPSEQAWFRRPVALRSASSTIEVDFRLPPAQPPSPR